MLRKTFRCFGATLIVFLLLLAAAWPWPAPEIDWRTPLKVAAHGGDCLTARNIVAALRMEEWQSVLQLVAVSADDRCRFAGDSDPVVLAYAPTKRTRQPLTTLDAYYSLDDNDLGALRHQYVRLSAFFCAEPYNREQSVDYVALAEAIPGNDGLVMAVHRARRSFCVGHREATIENLVNATGRAAKEVAWTALNRAPKHADLLYARLVLEQGFVPRQADHVPGVAKTIRKLAWDRLRDAATQGYAPAARLQAALLLQGRFPPPNDKEDYYLLLPLQR